MPKLNADIAQKVDNAEDGFTPVPDGVYVVEMAEDVDVREGAAGPYWAWTFQIPEDAEQFAGRKFWNNTSLSEAAFWKLKETFAAFGVPTDTDTEDLVKRRVKAVIVQEPIQKGPRKGEMRNSIESLRPLDDDSDESASNNPAQAKPKTAQGGGTDVPMF